MYTFHTEYKHSGSSVRSYRFNSFYALIWNCVQANSILQIKTAQNLFIQNESFSEFLLEMYDDYDWRGFYCKSVWTESWFSTDKLRGDLNSNRFFFIALGLLTARVRVRKDTTKCWMCLEGIAKKEIDQ